MRWFFLFTAAVCLAQPAPEKSSITGRVVSASTGAPLKKASVWLEAFAPVRGVNNPPTVAPVITDPEGRFSLQAVEPGSYQLIARRAGYLDQSYGAATPEIVGAPIELGAGETKRDLVVKLTPQSLIYGKVLDEDGDPVTGAEVAVLRVSYAGGRRHLVDHVTVASQDDGSFVAGGLPPGRYYLSARVRNMDQPQSRERYIPTYYPSVADAADAQPVEVAAGAEARGLTIRLRKARVYKIRGRVAMAEGYAAPGGLQLRLLPGNRGLRSQADGTFEIDGVPSGAYSIETDRFLSGRVAVTVADADVDGVVLPAGPGPAVDGRLTSAVAAKLSFTPLGRGPDFRAEFAAEPDGRFHTWGLLPLAYALEIGSLPEGSYVKAISFQGRPVTDWTVDLTSGAGGELVVDISPNGGEVTGKVDAPGAVVQIWPAGGDTARSVRADARGEFRFHSLAPGDYRVLAWQDLDDDLASYPPFRARFESDAVTVHIGERGHERVEPKRIGREAIAAEAAKLK